MKMIKKIKGWFKNKPRIKIALIGCLIVILIPITISLARFISDKLDDYYLQNKNFYFNSNRLKKNKASYQINNWTGVGDFTIEIEVNSIDNSLSKSDFDIAYDIDYTCPAEVLCSISKSSSVIYKATGTDTFRMTITPTREFVDGESVLISIAATSTQPYEATISADFQIIVGKRGVSYEITDEVNQPYLLVKITNAIDSYTVNTAFDSYSVGDQLDMNVYKGLSDLNKAKCSSASVTLGFDPNIVVLDTTSSLLKDAITDEQIINGVSYVNEISFKMKAMSSMEVRFYKLDYTQNYTYPYQNNNSIIEFNAE